MASLGAQTIITCVRCSYRSNYRKMRHHIKRCHKPAKHVLLKSLRNAAKGKHKHLELWYQMDGNSSSRRQCQAIEERVHSLIYFLLNSNKDTSNVSR